MSDQLSPSPRITLSRQHISALQALCAAQDSLLSQQEYYRIMRRKAHHKARGGNTEVIFKMDDDRTTRFDQTVMRFHLQALGIPRYSFRHSLQTQTLAVHMRPGAAALVRASSHRGGAHQQRQRQSPEPAERSPLPRPDLRHDIHSKYSQSEVNWKSAGGEI